MKHYKDSNNKIFAYESDYVTAEFSHNEII